MWALFREVLGPRLFRIDLIFARWIKYDKERMYPMIYWLVFFHMTRFRLCWQVGQFVSFLKYLLLRLHNKPKAAPEWMCDSSCSALSNKVCSDQECCFSAIPLTSKKICPLSVNDESIKYFLLLESGFFQTISQTGQITVFIMLLMSVIYCACFGNVTLGIIKSDINWSTGGNLKRR